MEEWCFTIKDIFFSIEDIYKKFEGICFPIRDSWFLGEDIFSKAKNMFFPIEDSRFPIKDSIFPDEGIFAVFGVDLNGRERTNRNRIGDRCYRYGWKIPRGKGHP
jgi:hypothetical protein